jgi:serine/threonine protein phosphatase PrpC
MSSTREVIAWVYGCTDVGVVRKNNEDAFVIAELGSHIAAQSTPPTGSLAFDPATKHGEEALIKKCVVGDQGLLLGVSDGMGGAEAGEIASYLVVESLKEDLSAKHDKSTGPLIRAAVERANHLVFDAAISHPRRNGMGATLTAALVREDRAYIAGVGDSRCYIIRGKRIRQVTRDQSLVESLVELGHLAPEQAESSPHRNVILQALGTKPEVAVALTRVSLNNGDILLLCSDGLSGKVNAEEMRELALAGPTIDDACRRMVALANERGGEDNITVVLAHFSGPALIAATDQISVTGTLKKIHGFNHAAGIGYEPESESETPTVDTEALTNRLPPAKDEA